VKYNHRFIAIDTETGGIPSVKNAATISIALTEIAVVVIENESLEIIHKDSWLIAPYDSELIYHPKAAEVSGITKQMLEKEGLGIEEVYKNFKKALTSNKIGRQKPILIMQNKKFDTPFLKNLFAIFNDNFEDYIDSVEDTLDWARKKFIEKPNFKLGSIADYCGIDHTEAHRAAADTLTTAQIWIYFMECLRGEGQNKQEESVTYRESFKF